MMGIDCYGSFWYNVDEKEFNRLSNKGCSGDVIGFSYDELSAMVVFGMSDGYFLKNKFTVLQK